MLPVVAGQCCRLALVKEIAETVDRAPGLGPAVVLMTRLRGLYQQDYSQLSLCNFASRMTLLVASALTACA